MDNTPKIVSSSDAPPVEPDVISDSVPDPEPSSAEGVAEPAPDVVPSELINPVMTNVAPYLDPTGAIRESVNPGTDVEYTPACPGSAGAKPVLTDIQNQMAENQAAAAEHREPLMVRVRCLLCGFFHKEQQAHVDDLTTMDDFSRKTITEPAADAPPAFDMKQAIDAVNGNSALTTEDNSDSVGEDDGETVGGDSDVQSSGTSTGS